MNVIFITQSGTLDVFHDLMNEMKSKQDLERVGFYVSNFKSYNFFKSRYPKFDKEFDILKEWNLTNIKDLDFDINKLEDFERKNKISLRKVIISDRRLSQGKNSTFFQDYKAHYHNSDLLKILAKSISEIETFVSNVNPNLVVSYNCVTFGEYLFYVICKSRGIKYINLRSLKIDNYVCYSDTIFRKNLEIESEYKKYYTELTPDKWIKRAKIYLTKVLETNVKYEGVHEYKTTVSLNILQYLNSFLRLFKEEYQYLKNNKIDSHLASPFKSTLFNSIQLKFNKLKFNNKSKEWVTFKDLKLNNYALFPLHMEPEASLLLHNSEYLNQIESIRLFSQNLPVGMKLFVKEHPRSIGRRSTNYYEKILEIPNVSLISPKVSMKDLICNCQLVTSVAGSVAFEGIVLRKPVVTLGLDHHCILPKHMIRHVSNINDLNTQIFNLIETYSYDRKAMESYIAAAMKKGVAVNFYSSLLGRDNRAMSDNNISKSERRKKDISKLADYTLTFAK